MRLWAFYIKDNNKYTLYAITNKKDFLKMFKKQRNMNIFEIKEIEGDKDYLIKFMNDYRGNVIDLYELSTRKDDSDKEELINIDILMTEHEFTIIKDNAEMASEIICSDSYWSNNHVIDYYVYNNKIIDALKVIDYDDFYNIFVRSYQKKYNESFSDSPDARIDEVMAFLRIFKETF